MPELFELNAETSEYTPARHEIGSCRMRVHVLYALDPTWSVDEGADRILPPECYARRRMNAASPFYVPYEDYLVLEASGDARHEWCDGVVYAMSRGTPEHARLVARILRALALPEECEGYASDMMIYIELARLSTYADASVVCGAVETKKVMKNGRSLGEAVTNPTILVEVLSESTERYDRDGKFQAYKLLASLREYVLVSQDRPFIEVYRRSGARWTCETAGPGERVTVRGAKLDVDLVYGRVRAPKKRRAAKRR